jgi:Phosphotransferase enzyme family
MEKQMVDNALWEPSWNKPFKEDTAQPLPLEVDEVTAQWLTKALSIDIPGLVVNGATVTKARHGFTSVLHVTIDVNEVGRKAGLPTQIIVKGGFTQYSREYAFAYAMEAHGYRDIYAHGVLNVPKVFFVNLDLDRKQSIIIMEDLTLRGVTFGHGLKPIGYDLMARRMAALAKFHSLTWDSPDIKPGGKYADFLGNIVRLNRLHMEQHGYVILGDDEMSRGRSDLHQMPAFLSPEGWQTMFEERMSQNAAASHAFRDYEWNKRAIATLEAISDFLPNCIVHGDTHLGNHYEEPDGTPGFFDSMPARSPAQFDIAYTLGTGLDPYDRRKWERALIGHYLAELGRQGIHLDFDETMFYYSLFLHAGYIVFIINDPVWQTPAFNTVHVWRFCSAMMDNNTKEAFERAFKMFNK